MDFYTVLYVYQKRSRGGGGGGPRGLFVAMGYLMTFKAILQALEGGELKFIDVTQNFKIFIRKKCNKIRSSPNPESYLHMQIKIIVRGAVCLRFNKLQLKIIFICSNR